MTTERQKDDQLNGPYSVHVGYTHFLSESIPARTPCPWVAPTYQAYRLYEAHTTNLNSATRGSVRGERTEA
jgi:hypothetical protein